MLASGLSTEVGGAENLARFLYSDSHFAATKGMVKVQAFLPSQNHDPDFQAVALSIGRVMDLAASEICELGRTYRPKDKCKAYAYFSVSRVPRALQCVPAEPPIRHAVLLGWPDGEDAKEARRDLAEQLAHASSLNICGRSA